MICQVQGSKVNDVSWHQEWTFKATIWARPPWHWENSSYEVMWSNNLLKSKLWSWSHKSCQRNLRISLLLSLAAALLCCSGRPPKELNSQLYWSLKEQLASEVVVGFFFGKWLYVTLLADFWKADCWARQAWPEQSRFSHCELMLLLWVKLEKYELLKG